MGGLIRGGSELCMYSYRVVGGAVRGDKKREEWMLFLVGSGNSVYSWEKADRRRGGWRGGVVQKDGTGIDRCSGLFLPVCFFTSGFQLFFLLGWGFRLGCLGRSVSLTDSDNTAHRTPTRQWVQRTTAALLSGYFGPRPPSPQGSVLGF